MRKQVDVEFFLLVVAREMSYCDGMRNALNGYYREQKTRFYEIAKKSKYYNHFIMSEGSLEHEINIKRIFGILLCADNDCELRNLVIKLIVSYKSDMKFLSNQKLDIAKYALYMKKQQNKCIDDGHNVPGRDVDFWLQTYILYYNHAEHMSEDLQQSFYKYILSETKDTKDEVYKTEKSKINDVNWKKQLNIPEYVSLGINELDSEEVLYTLGDILGIGTYEDLNDKASNLFDIFMDRDITNAKREIKFRDIVRTSAFCLLLDNMLKAEGLNFFSIYTEKVISKKDKEYLLKAIAKSLSGTYASALNTDEISIKKNKDGEMIFSPEYDLAYSDIVLAFLFKGLIRAIKDNKKYAISNYPENLFANETINKMSNAETANYEKQLDSLKNENEKLKNEIENLKNTIAQKDKNLATAIRKVEAKYEETIKEKDEFISVAKEHLIDNVEFIYLLMSKYPDEEEVDTEELPPYDLLELQQKRILVVGGRIEKIQELRKLLPKAVFVSNETEKVPDTKFDLIFFFNNYLSHALFSKYIAKAREENISVGYSIKSNIHMALAAMCDGLKNARTSIFSLDPDPVTSDDIENVENK